MQTLSQSSEPHNPFADYISRDEFCRRASISKRTAELYAHARKGPKVTLIGGRAYYHVDDVRTWLDSLRKIGQQRAPRRRGVA